MKPFDIIREFLSSEKAGGFILILCTVLSLVITNSAFGENYLQIWNFTLAGGSVVHWINDGLMAFFFLLIGLELKSEFTEGQFNNIKTALLPIFAAIGGMLIPAAFHALFNYGTATQAGAGIPMATDAAFALAILSLVGKRAPFALKMLLLAIAVVDDLCAIIVIAVFYTGSIGWLHLGIALLVFVILWVLNRTGIKNVFIYMAGGIIMWYFMLHSGVHPTISGVLLAIVLPFKKDDENSTAIILQHRLHKPVAFVILPLFTLANTCIALSGNFMESLSTQNSIGILSGLVIGKPLGIFLFGLVAIKSGMGSLHSDLGLKHLFGVGILAGIGFTISIFVSLLAFADTEIINQSKIAVLTASVIAAIIAFVWLTLIAKKNRVMDLQQNNLF